METKSLACFSYLTSFVFFCYLHAVTIVRQVKECLNEVEASPGEDLLVLEVRLHLEDLCGGGVTLLLSEAEDVRIS